MKIYGAGLAGLLAGHMLRRYEPKIHEKQSSLPNNHEAVLRFRSEAVSIATAIPFKKIHVTKQVSYEGSVIDSPVVVPMLANMYSVKVTGHVFSRSIVNLDPVERWIAPPNFIAQLARGLNIIYESSLDVLSLQDTGVKISTIPMPALLKLFDTPDCFEIPQFEARPVWNVVIDIKSPTIDVYQTTYYPGNEPYYRATLMGQRLIIEYSEEPNYIAQSVTTLAINDVLKTFGINCKVVVSTYRTHHMPYGKLIPMDLNIRQGIIRTATEKYQCYSLGRFGTWRQILLDDVVNDVKVIERLIDSDPYTRALVEAT